MRSVKWKYLLVMPIFMLMGFFLSACCGTKMCEVKVIFEGVDEHLDFKDYSYKVEFNQDTDIVIEIPEGFDESKAVATIDGIVQTPKITYLEEIEDEYKYTIGKTVTYSLTRVRRPFEIKIDLTEMPRLQFNVKLNSLTNCNIVTVPKEKLDRIF